MTIQEIKDKLKIIKANKKFMKEHDVKISELHEKNEDICCVTNIDGLIIDKYTMIFNKELLADKLEEQLSTNKRFDEHTKELQKTLDKFNIEQDSLVAEMRVTNGLTTVLSLPGNLPCIYIESLGLTIFDCDWQSDIYDSCDKLYALLKVIEELNKDKRIQIIPNVPNEYDNIYEAFRISIYVKELDLTYKDFRFYYFVQYNETTNKFDSMSIDECYDTICKVLKDKISREQLYKENKKKLDEIIGSDKDIERKEFRIGVKDSIYYKNYGLDISNMLYYENGVDTILNKIYNCECYKRDHRVFKSNPESLIDEIDNLILEIKNRKCVKIDEYFTSDEDENFLTFRVYYKKFILTFDFCSDEKNVELIYEKDNFYTKEVKDKLEIILDTLKRDI